MFCLGHLRVLPPMGFQYTVSLNSPDFGRTFVVRGYEDAWSV